MPRSSAFKFSLPLRYQHWRYVWIPIFGAFIWFSTLLAMLITWLATGHPKYASQEGKIAYISDIGASYLKPLFIVGCSITAVCFILTLVIERWLKFHSGRLVPDKRKAGRICGILAVVGAFIGGMGLILLSVFDTAQYTRLHRIFLLVFMVGVALSAIFTVVEYHWICKDFPDIQSLRKSYLAKAIIAGTLIILAIIFTGCLFSHTPGAQELGAILEWLIAFGFTFYLLSFYLDLRRSKNVERGAVAQERLVKSDTPQLQREDQKNDSTPITESV